MWKRIEVGLSSFWKSFDSKEFINRVLIKRKSCLKHMDGSVSFCASIKWELNTWGHKQKYKQSLGHMLDRWNFNKPEQSGVCSLNQTNWFNSSKWGRFCDLNFIGRERMTCDLSRTMDNSRTNCTYSSLIIDNCFEKSFVLFYLMQEIRSTSHRNGITHLLSETMRWR